MELRETVALPAGGTLCVCGQREQHIDRVTRESGLVEWVLPCGQLFRVMGKPTPEDLAILVETAQQTLPGIVTAIMLAEIEARIIEETEHPDCFLFLGHGDLVDPHRRGDRQCVQGLCHGDTEPLPICPICQLGVVHRSVDVAEPAVCDWCGTLAGG